MTVFLCQLDGRIDNEGSKPFGAEIANFMVKIIVMCTVFL